MTKILGPLLTDNIDDTKYVRLIAPFRFVSDVLYREGLANDVTMPAGFVMDFESVPLIRGTSKRAGAAHDYLCRSDSVPLVSKAVAARVYLEIMEYRDGLLEDGPLGKLDRWWLRRLKYAVVRVAPGYFHKHKVSATYEELAGLI